MVMEIATSDLSCPAVADEACPVLQMHDEGGAAEMSEIFFQPAHPGHE